MFRLYRLTRVELDKIQGAVKQLSVCLAQAKTTKSTADAEDEARHEFEILRPRQGGDFKLNYIWNSFPIHNGERAGRWVGGHVDKVTLVA